MAGVRLRSIFTRRGQGRETAVFRISARGSADRQAKDLNRKQREIQDEVLEGLLTAAARSVDIMRGFAPKSAEWRPLVPDIPVPANNPGQLERNIEIVGFSRTVRNPHIRVGVNEDKVRSLDASPGFKYLGVSRFGRGSIQPKTARRATSGSRPTARAFASGPNRAGVPGLGRSAMLHFPRAPGLSTYRKQVGPWSPAGDWAAKADPFVRATANEAMQATGRRISRDLKSGFSREARVRRLP